MSARRGVDLFSAADVARFCAVDLKTIHNWADRGKLPHHKTEGRHVRVHRVDLVAFLRAYEMPLPRALTEGDARPRVVALDPDAPALARLRRALEKRFAVDAFEDAVDALVAIGEAPPEVVVTAAPLPGTDVARVIARLRAIVQTAHVRFVVVADDDVPGATSRVARDKLATAHVREALLEITGLA